MWQNQCAGDIARARVDLALGMARSVKIGLCSWVEIGGRDGQSIRMVCGGVVSR